MCDVFFLLKNNIRFVAFFFFPIAFLNKTNCFTLHNTIKPLHLQYQCPITDYMYGKLSQISCIKKMSFLLKNVNITIMLKSLSLEDQDFNITDK